MRVILLAFTVVISTASGSVTDQDTPRENGPLHAVDARGSGDHLTSEVNVRTDTARGEFDVTLTPQPVSADLGRLTMAKRFHGDLEGTSEGEMLSWQDEPTGAAAYVAIERVTGSLDGRTGSFVLTHRGTMTPAAQRLTVAVVPGSGTGDLAGIEGTMAIDISDGKHAYELEYHLPEH